MKSLRQEPYYESHFEGAKGPGSYLGKPEFDEFVEFY